MKDKISLIFISLCFFRLALLNFNVAEWGDSYNFVRAADFLARSEYPLDEKRLPLFPLLISVGLPNFESVFFGRIIVFVFTVGCLYLTFKLGKALFPKITSHQLTLIFLFFSPVFLYWSLRVMAEVVFTFLVVLSFYYFYSANNPKRNHFILGLLVGLASLTRFEGNLLFLSFLLYFCCKNSKINILFKRVFFYSLSFVLIQLPWLAWKYFTFGSISGSIYFSEVSTFNYDSASILTFIGSLVFLFGFPSAAYFVALALMRLKEKSKISFLPIFLFIAFELVLIFSWPAAIPRLFFPLLPFLAIFFVVGVAVLKEGDRKKTAAASFLLLLIHAVLRHRFRPYFLVLSKSGFFIIIALSLVSALIWIIPDFKKAKRYFLSLALVSSLLSSSLILLDHRNIYASVYRIAKKAQSLQAPVAYFDETGVSRWYLRKNGLYYPKEYLDRDAWGWLMENKVKYILWTDEHNEGSTLNIVKEAQFKDNFRLINKYSQEMPDYLDKFLIEKGFLAEKQFPLKNSEIYEVVY